MPAKIKLNPEMRGDTWGPYRVEFSNILTVCDGACSTGAPTKITSLTAGFTSASLNKKITLAGAGPSGAGYTGKITAVDSGTQVTVCPAISTTLSGKELGYGVAEDITGDKLWMTLKRSNTDPDPGVAQFRDTMPVNANSTAGIGFVTPDSTETDIEPGTYVFDIQRVTPGTPPIVRTRVYGSIEVLADTTKSVA